MPDPQRQELDAAVTFRQQLEDGEQSPVVLVNTFTVAPDDIDKMLEAWAEDSAAMKKQPGFISAQLHRGTCGSGVFVNVAVWESPALLQAAVRHPDFLAARGKSPASAIARPHLFRKVAVRGICTE